MTHPNAEAPIHTPERVAPLQHAWEMEMQPDHPETVYEVVPRIVDRFRVYGPDDLFKMGESAGSPPTIAHIHQKANGELNMDLTKASAAVRWMDNDAELYGVNVDRVWWRNLDWLHGKVAGDIFRSKMPNEQFIIGQGDKGIRFYNFGGDLSADNRADLRTFVDSATQYQGERTYKYLQDVIITDFTNDGISKKVDEDGKKTEEQVLGFVHPKLPGAIFINSKILNFTDRPEDLNGSQLLQTLDHEFGHLVDGTDTGDTGSATQLAREIGWDYDRMMMDLLMNNAAKDDHSHDDDLAAYRPPAAYGSRKRIAVLPNGAMLPLMDPDFTALIQDTLKHIETNGEHPKPKMVLLGSPTEYGGRNPLESTAEITKHAMLGGVVLNYLMPQARDGWLAHMERRRDGPIVVPLDREPITVEYRAGSEILYPRIELPDVINVRFIPPSPGTRG